MSEGRGLPPQSARSLPAEAPSDLEAALSTENPKQHGPKASYHSEPDAAADLPEPFLRRRQTRAGTNRSSTTVDFSPWRPNWRPGQEPGLDPSKPNGGRPQTPTLHEECQITVVDFSEDDIALHDLDNAKLIQFLDKKQAEWIKCRWINVNGLSWDVIQALGNHKKLHRLAIEDLINTNNRTKADW
jgi:hypothetical protein